MSAISISVKGIPKNEQYRSLFRDLSHEIFLLDDSIQGNFQINVAKTGKIKHKGINVKLIGRYCMNDLVINEFAIHQMEICDPGIIDNNFSADFTFDKPRIQYNTYHGYKMSLSYFIVVDIKQANLLSQKITQFYEIYFFLPYKRTNPIPPISMSVSLPNVSFDVLTSKGIYSTTDILLGEIGCKNIYTPIDKISMHLVLTEKLKDKKELKSEETTIFEYELTDGIPIAGSRIPFRISLQPFHIWTIRAQQSNSILTTDFMFEIYVHKGTNATLVAQHVVFLYLRYI